MFHTGASYAKLMTGPDINAELKVRTQLMDADVIYIVQNVLLDIKIIARCVIPKYWEEFKTTVQLQRIVFSIFCAVFHSEQINFPLNRE